ncbi:MAG: AIR carboxylase family protein [bacterium]
MTKVVIIIGSKADINWSKRIASFLEKFGIEPSLRIASAHKTPLKCLEIIKEYENDNVIFITVAGRSNALSGLVDFQTHLPVITCPPNPEWFDIFSSIRMPSSVASMLVLEPENAALAALKILGLKDKEIQEKIRDYQKNIKESLATNDYNG